MVVFHSAFNWTLKIDVLRVARYIFFRTQWILFNISQLFPIKTLLDLAPIHHSRMSTSDETLYVQCVSERKANSRNFRALSREHSTSLVTEGRKITCSEREGQLVPNRGSKEE